MIHKQKDYQQLARQLITKLLARREYSQFELRQKLKEKQIPAEIAEVQLNKFIHKELQSDERFAEALLKHAVMKGKGPEYIRQQLAQHELSHISAEEIATSLEIDWYELALNVRKKKFGEELTGDWEQRQKQKRFLYARGFNLEHIDAAFSAK